MTTFQGYGGDERKGVQVWVAYRDIINTFNEDRVTVTIQGNYLLGPRIGMLMVGSTTVCFGQSSGSTFLNLSLSFIPLSMT